MNRAPPSPHARYGSLKDQMALEREHRKAERAAIYDARRLANEAAAKQEAARAVVAAARRRCDEAT